MVNVFRKEDFLELVILIIMILMNGIFGVNGSGNVVNLLKYLIIIY